ncbi:MAG: ribonuclease HII [Pisciglobus halotolerans]|nr:ribonuclease HII [Pisciglobus halotolerans]
MTQEKKESIKEIKQLLNQVTAPSEEWLTTLRSDERKGVQLAIKSWENKQVKAKAKEETFQERLQFEKSFWQKGIKSVAGIDEVGRGPLAGPVVAAAVILPEEFHLVDVDDSKQLSVSKRNSLFEAIQHQALSIGVGIVESDVIDRVNIYQATKLAMTKAVNQLTVVPEQLLIDAMTIATPIPQTKLIKGDMRSISIGAASIMAKVTRDRMMEQYDEKYPGYGFTNNAGYGTKEHLVGLQNKGPCPIHRMSFAPVREAKRLF